MALRGDTSNLLLADIFQTLAQNGQAGLLTLQGEGKRQRILFSPRGITALDAEALRAPRLGHLLVAAGLIERSRIDAALGRLENSGTEPGSALPLLDLLEEEKALARAVGVRVLQNEVREELVEVFTLQRMDFEFDEGDVPVEGIPGQCYFRAEEIVFEAARRLDEWELIKRELGEVQEYYVLEAHAEGEEADPRVLKLLNGRNTVVDVAERLLLSRFEVARQVWRLLEARRIRPATADELIRAARELDPVAQGGAVARILQRARAHLKPSDARLDEVGELLIRAGATSAAISALLVRARSLLAEGNGETAYALVARARDLDASNSGVLQTLAEIHHERGEREAEAKVLTGLAEKSAAQQQFGDAVEYATRVARLDPEAPLLDRAFAIYCQQAHLEKHGADVLSEAAGRRASPARTAMLYDSILQLDPGRADIRKAKARQRRARSRRRGVWFAAALLIVPLCLAGLRWVLTRLKEERLAGRLEAAELLLDQGQAELAEGALLRVLAEEPPDAVEESATELLGRARTALADHAAAERAAHEQKRRGALTLVQDDLEARRYAEALGRMRDLEAPGAVPPAEQQSLAAKHQLLERKLADEHAALLRLAARFQVPDTDSALLEVQAEYGAAFAPERLRAFQELVRLLEDQPEAVAGGAASLLSRAREGRDALQRIVPEIQTIEGRIARNEQLDQLSDDYQQIRAALAAGAYATAIGAYDRLLESYGEGPLTPLFQQQRASAQAVALALREVEALLAEGRIEEANQRARRCAAEAPDLEVARVAGMPVRVATLPAGSDLRAGERALGSAPAVLWVKDGAPQRVCASAPGFLPCEREISYGSAPELRIELPRASRFQVDLGTPVDVRPLASNGDLYIGARDGVLYRLDLFSGRRLDTHATGSLSGIAAPPLEHGALLLLALGEGEVRAVERATLALRWHRPHEGALAGPPLLAGARLLVATVDGRILEIDAATGEERLVAGVTGPLRSGPALLGSAVAAGATNGSIIAVSQDDGRLLFATPERPHPIVGLAVAAGLIVAADDGGTLLALDPGDGGVRWQRETGQAAAAPPAACGEQIVFAAGRTAFVLDGKSGAVSLAAEVGAWIAGTPALAGGRLYVCDHAGLLSVFDLGDGELLYRHQLDGRVRAAPLVLEQGLLLITERGTVTLLEA